MNPKAKNVAGSNAVNKLWQLLNDKAGLKNAPGFFTTLNGLGLESGLSGESVIDGLKKLKNDSAIIIGETFLRNPEWYDEQVLNSPYFNFVFRPSPFKRKGRQVQSEFLFTDFYQYNGGDEVFIALWDSPELNKNQQIKCLDLVMAKNGTKFQIVVNSDFGNPLEADYQKYRYWKLIYKLAKKEPVEIKDFESEIENLNTNKNLKLYTQTGLNITKFLGNKNGYIESKIPIQPHTVKWLTQKRI